MHIPGWMQTQHVGVEAASTSYRKPAAACSCFTVCCVCRQGKCLLHLICPFSPELQRMETRWHQDTESRSEVPLVVVIQILDLTWSRGPVCLCQESEVAYSNEMSSLRRLQACQRPGSARHRSGPRSAEAAFLLVTESHSGVCFGRQGSGF